MTVNGGTSDTAGDTSSTWKFDFMPTTDISSFGGTITVTFPATGFDLTDVGDSSLTGCGVPPSGTPSGNEVTFSLNPGGCSDITASTPVVLRVVGVDASAATYPAAEFSVATSADTTAEPASGTDIAIAAAAAATGLTTTSGPVGTSTSLSLTGFAATSPLTVTVDGVAATVTGGGTTDGSGAATVTFTIPPVPNGSQQIVVSDGASNEADSDTDFAVEAAVTGLNPTTAGIGSSVTLAVSGFAATSSLGVTVGGTTATITNGGTTDGTGSSTITFTVPGVSLGSNPVVVTDAASDATSSGTNLTVTAGAAAKLVFTAQPTSTVSAPCSGRSPRSRSRIRQATRFSETRQV